MKNFKHGTHVLIAMGIAWPLALTACGDDDGNAKAEEAFQMCLADVEPSCSLVKMDTAEKIETACFDLTGLGVPLTDGGMHGPKTIKGGPYGGKAEWNQGAGTEFVNDVNSLEPSCLPFGIESFQEPDAVNQQLENTRGIDYSLYTIFRPACMKDGETYPVITWANGTCGLTHGYAPLLATVASHGFVVIASNSTWTATAPTDMVQTRALDYAEALNSNPESIFYERLDLDHIGAMGHSQGATATRNAASDPRIKALILWNGGTSEDKPFLNVSGERDIDKSITPDSMAEETEAASQAGAWIFYKQVLQTGGHSTGHLVLMEEPERVVGLAIDWWNYWLKNDAKAKAKFVGNDCTYCTHPKKYEFGVNGLFEDL